VNWIDRAYLSRALCVVFFIDFPLAFLFPAARSTQRGVRTARWWENSRDAFARHACSREIRTFFLSDFDSQIQKIGTEAN